MTAPLGRLLDSARRVAGLSYEAWATAAETTPSYLHRICAGQASPARDMVIRMAIGLGLPAASVDVHLRAAGHLGWQADARRDRLIQAAIECGLSVPQIHGLLNAAGWPGLLESSRRPGRPAESGGSAAYPPSSPETHATAR